MDSGNYGLITMVNVWSNYRMNFTQMSHEHFERNVLTARRHGVTRDNHAKLISSSFVKMFYELRDWGSDKDLEFLGLGKTFGKICQDITTDNSARCTYMSVLLEGWDLCSEWKNKNFGM